jgi:uncharacterized membrane protein YbjE (DUF340 family)
MLIVVVIMASGIAIGYLIRRKEFLIKINDRLTMWAIYLLLFLLGISIGTNDVIMKSLTTLGLKALAISIGGIIGSISLAWLAYIVFFKGKD